MIRAGTPLRRFVLCALTRSTHPRQLFPSELLRHNSSSTAAALAYSSPQNVSNRVSVSSSNIVADVDASASEPSSSQEKETTTEQESDAKDPSLSFHTLSSQIHPATLKAITKTPFKHTHMSPVQAQILPLLPELALPHTLHPGTTARDLLVKAKTGTGKTMAFLVPAIEARLAALSQHLQSTTSSGVKLSDADRLRSESTYAKSHVGCLIISPTRELATQIAVEATNLTSHHKGFTTQVLLGGESKFRQMKLWGGGRKDIVVATPGRILDLLNTEPSVAEAIRKCNLLILDEADTLLDMGFRDDITRLLTYLPPQPIRQTFLFSATVSRAIQQIAQASLSPSHRYVNCVAKDDSPVHAHIPQHVTVLKDGADLLPHVLRLIACDQLQYPGSLALSSPSSQRGVAVQQAPPPSKIIIFLSTTNMVTLFTLLLRKSLSLSLLPTPSSHTSLFEMHAKRDMSARQRVSSLFRSSTSPSSILVTSDVSARGVDYPGVTRVIQVGLPSGRDVYVHRVGRTGRGGRKEGRGDLVVMDWESGFVKGKLRDVGLLDVRKGDVERELKERGDVLLDGSGQLVEGGEGNTVFGRAKREEIALSARQITHAIGSGDMSSLRPSQSSSSSKYPRNRSQQTHQDPSDPADMVRGAFASHAGFFAGRASEQGLDVREVLKGLKRMWMEMWGLERELHLPRMLEAGIGMGGGGGGYSRGGGGGGYGGSRGGGGGYGGRSSYGGGGGYGRRDNDRGGYTSSRGGYDASSSGGGGGWGGNSAGWGKPKTEYTSTSDSISGYYSTRGGDASSSRGGSANDGYGYEKGARAGGRFSRAGGYTGSSSSGRGSAGYVRGKNFTKSRGEALWETGGEGAWGSRRGRD